ncbi:uncharacterized protein [Macrobrachium rosenbergii]|uniref:uncharacterized protein n=1 Tax=Macrobrachium rosenbergii TaxID=79674 RepID=UPI0034D5BAAE
MVSTSSRCLPSKKPNKITVVFDCSAKYQGSSLNDKLMQGPDMTNSLIGVLIRFRLERVALMGDIESMFYQVQVPKVQHKYLRFLWWPGGEIESELTEYRMGVHIFGAVSSPSIANYALRAAADHARDKYGPDVERTIKTNFYADDYLKSVPSEEQALRLVKDVTAALKERGFRLTKFVTKRILCEVCQDSSIGWDDVIPKKYLKPWRRWLDDLPILGNLKIPRCVKPKEFGTVTSTQLHMFSDASNEGYGAAAYIRLSDNMKVIKDFSENTQWRYVQSKENPADIASRGFTSQQILNSNIWFDGPYFLRGPEELWKNDMPQGVVELEGSTSFCSASRR